MIDLANGSARRKQKASRTAQLIAFAERRRARAGRRATIAALAREGYMNNAIVHRAVQAGRGERSRRSPGSPYDGSAEHDAHPLLDLMARPNPRQDGATFLEAWSRICCSRAMPISRR